LSKERGLPERKGKFCYNTNMEKVPLSFEYQEDKGVIKIFGEGVGMLYFVVEEEIRLKDAIVYESNKEGKCIGIEVAEEKVKREKFRQRLTQFAKEKNIRIVK